MAEQTFRSPGFFDKEIDLSFVQQNPSGVPAGVIGSALRGPAFVPVTVGSFADFETRFGGLDRKRFAPYAVKQFLVQANALTFIRVLGAGANTTITDFDNTRRKGIVKNAGFTLTGSVILGNSGTSRNSGVVQFLCARQFLSASHELVGMPMFSDNASFAPGPTSVADNVSVLRAVLFTASGTQFYVGDFDANLSADAVYNGDTATVIDQASGGSGGMPAFTFKLMLSNSDGLTWGDSAPDRTSGTEKIGIRYYTASLDPHSDFYVAKILNTDPNKFREKKHLLYADFAVDHEVAPLSIPNKSAPSVFLTSGTMRASLVSGDTSLNLVDAFGRYDTRYTTPRTTAFISQPFADKEYDLFWFETISDGQYANDKFKISIANLVASTDPALPYGRFEIQVRTFDDTDSDRKIIERYADCSLDPLDARYVGRVVGDFKARYNHDAMALNERRVVVSGEYPNRSSLIRIQLSDDLRLGRVPATAMPFGFRGIPTWKTTDSLTDRNNVTITVDGTPLGSDTADAASLRLSCTPGGIITKSTTAYAEASASIVPPLPYRFKTTVGAIASTANFVGEAGSDERPNTKFYWGVQNTSVPQTGTFGQGTAMDIRRPNEGTTFNRVVNAYTRFAGIAKLDTLLTGSGKDYFNSNKFTLARVGFANGLSLGTAEGLTTWHISTMTGTAKAHMLDAAYIRNGQVDSQFYTVKELTFGATVEANNPPFSGHGRITPATLINSSSVVFNRFTDYMKFTNIFYGGFDGLNILDSDMALMNDRASATRSGGGKAAKDWNDTGLGKQPNNSTNPAGNMEANNAVNAYIEASSIMTDQHQANANILVVPGIRTQTVSDAIAIKVKSNGMMFYIIDIAEFTENDTRVYAGTGLKADVRATAESFASRNIDNNYLGTYFPDVWIEDSANNTLVKVPPSVTALGVFSYTDKKKNPWWAPAGFDRGALSSVKNVDVRLSSADRDTLYDNRINPIATFPQTGIGGAKFVIFGQKTLQAAKSALDRINVRRMLLEVKRLIFSVARNLLFEQNTPALRARFIANATIPLAMVQAHQGIEQFRIVMDDSNNTIQDFDANRLNGRIVIVPTRAIEFIAIDFIITPTGVEFV